MFVYNAQQINIEQKIEFIGYTLLHLFIQLSITFITAYSYKYTIIRRKWLYIIASMGLLLLIQFSSFLPFWVRLGLFFVYSIVNGIFLSGFLKHVPKTEIKEAIGQTVSIFIAMLLIGWVFHKQNINITPIIYAIFFISIAILILTLYLLFIDTSVNIRKITRSLIILLMTIYIVYDTYRNLSKEYEGDIINATMDYYLDIYNIFTSILSINNE
jgi:FtsH-binding integral membrane protein